MDKDDMDDVLRSLMPDDYEPSPALLAARRWHQEIQQMLDQARAELGLGTDERIHDMQLHSEMADLFNLEQTQEIQTWFILRLNGEIEREFEQVAAAMLLNEGEFVEAMVTGHMPTWLAPRVSAFLASRT